MDELTNQLNNIITAANDIKECIAEDWYKLFVERKGFFEPFGKELADVYTELSNIRDVMYEELTDE